MKRLTKHLILVPCTEESLPQAFDEDYPVGPHIAAYIDELKNDPSALGWGPWFIISRETLTIIGDAGFKGVPDKNGAVETGYSIIPSEQNKGLATEAVAALIDWACSTGEASIVRAECHKDNVPSIRVLEKTGMVREKEVESMIYWEKPGNRVNAEDS
ncbi:GNAT family N-acetyltransferase [Bacillus sp. H-16]|uniref:GNAT family N-acetyltransferase n=1 Tax=Alteribacter salitolerans TaxID=2912333 RepID=UPI001964F14D|nr:GNAT family N-acetyltransferase [Alteribacter salitolerans]MBM7096707.1 GNAT family N-acetyltransferase [Alteribacter salitolerans]